MAYFTYLAISSYITKCTIYLFEENQTFATMTKFAEIASVIGIAIYNTYPYSMARCFLHNFMCFVESKHAVCVYKLTILVGLVLLVNRN